MWAYVWIDGPAAANGGDITSKVVFEYYSGAMSQNKYERAHEQAEG